MYMGLCFLLSSISLCIKYNMYLSLSALAEVDTGLHVPKSRGPVSALVYLACQRSWTWRSPFQLAPDATLSGFSYFSQCSLSVSSADSALSVPPLTLGSLGQFGLFLFSAYTYLLVSWFDTLLIDWWLQDVYLYILNINLQPRPLPWTPDSCLLDIFPLLSDRHFDLTCPKTKFYCSSHQIVCCSLILLNGSLTVPVA